MFNFDKKDLQRFTVSSVGAVALSAICIFGVAGPAQAGTVKEWKAGIEHQLDRNAVDLTQTGENIYETKVALHFTAEGDYAGATIAKSSGSRSLDKGALYSVADMKIAALPEAQRGRERVVIMRLLHNAPAAVVAAERAKENRIVTYAQAATGGSIKVAAK